MRDTGRPPHGRCRRAEPLPKETRERMAVAKAAGQCDFTDRQGTFAEELSRSLEPHIDKEGIRRLFVDRAECSYEVEPRVVRHSRQEVVVDVEVTMGSEVVPHALQSQKHLDALRVRAPRAARDRGAER